ncbi:flagellar assembly protein FliH [Marinobacteraceae bacterium S3BR75-40.1]
MKDRSQQDRIPSEDLTAYERWELPALDEQGNEVSKASTERVKPLTAEELENIRQEGYKDGKEEGYQEGFTQGREAGHQEGYQAGLEEGRQTGREEGQQQALQETRSDVQERLERLTSLMEDLLDPISKQEDQLEGALINLTLALSRSVIYRELSLDSRHIRQALREAIQSLPDADEQITLHINPADQQWVQEVADQLEFGARIQLNDQILPGGCKVENRQSLVDFTVEKRFQKAIQQMLDRQLTIAPEEEHGDMDAMMGEMSDFHRDLLVDEDPASEGTGTEHGDAAEAQDSRNVSAESSQQSEAEPPKDDSASGEGEHEPPR